MHKRARCKTTQARLPLLLLLTEVRLASPDEPLLPAEAEEAIFRDRDLYLVPQIFKGAYLMQGTVSSIVIDSDTARFRIISIIGRY